MGKLTPLFCLKKDRDELIGLIIYSFMQDTSGLTE
jgi:hypothetical protein